MMFDDDDVCDHHFSVRLTKSKCHKSKREKCNKCQFDHFVIVRNKFGESLYFLVVVVSCKCDVSDEKCETWATFIASRDDHNAHLVLSQGQPLQDQHQAPRQGNASPWLSLWLWSILMHVINVFSQISLRLYYVLSVFLSLSGCNLLEQERCVSRDNYDGAEVRNVIKFHHLHCFVFISFSNPPQEFQLKSRQVLCTRVVVIKWLRWIS